MQTRRLRLGDVVDDYCPRERRLSNHVIAAMVDDTIKQTRCSTCDFEHPYKEARIPARRKKKDATSELFQQVLDNVTEGVKPSAAAPADPVAPDAPVTPAPVVAAADVEPDVVQARAPRRRTAPKRTGRRRARAAVQRTRHACACRRRDFRSDRSRGRSSDRFRFDHSRRDACETRGTHSGRAAHRARGCQQPQR